MGTGQLLASEKLLLVNAKDIPRVSSVLDKLAAAWDVSVENVTAPPTGKKASRG